LNYRTPYIGIRKYFFNIYLLYMICEICDRKFNSPPSYYRHRTWNERHLLKEQIMLFEKEIRDLEAKVKSTEINEPRNQPFYLDHNKFQKSPIEDLTKVRTWYYLDIFFQ